MAEGRESSEWTRVSQVLALTANCHRSEKQKPFEPWQFNPFAPKHVKKNLPKVPITVLKCFLPKDQQG